MPGRQLGGRWRTNVPFGKELQEEREKRGVSLETVADETKVSTRFLRALEVDDFGSLPGGVFQRGIVRSYCRFLGLDEQEWLTRFALTMDSGSEADWTTFAVNVKRTRVAAKVVARAADAAGIAGGGLGGVAVCGEAEDAWGGVEGFGAKFVPG